MNVWTVFPTANPELAKRAIDRWRERGYKVATLRDQSCPTKIESDFPVVVADGYEGYWSSVNVLVGFVRREHGPNDIFVAAADDMDPDPNHTAQEIAAQYLEHFPAGDGIMQPCGDAQGMESWESFSKRCPEAVPLFDKPRPVPAAARIAGSPWFGRGWAKRAFGGRGPMPEGYFHYYGDEELYEVARRAGKLWLRPDLTQFHHHWSWGHRPLADYNERNQKHWEADQKLFFERKAAGFPGSEFLR